MGVETLISARGALETTRGTKVDMTRKLYFEQAMHAQEIATIRPKEQRGSYFGSFRAYPGIERNSFDFSGGVTFEDLIWWLNIGVKALASGTAGGTGDEAAITWGFTPTAASDDLKSATIEFDLNGPTLFQVPGCMADELSLAFKKGEDAKFTAKVLSHAAAAQIAAYTGTGADRTTESVLGTKTVVYTDGSTIGSTEDDVEEVTFKLMNHMVHRDALDATTVAKELKRPQPRSWELEVSRYFATDTELDAYIAKTERKVRVRTEGSVISGTSSSIKRKVDLDCYGVWDKHTWAKVDGLIYARMTLVPLYDSTAATDFELEVINDVASIT